MLLGPGNYNANTQKQSSALFTVDCARESLRQILSQTNLVWTSERMNQSNRPPMPCCHTKSTITVLPQFSTIEPHFVRKSCAGPVKIAILPQFLAIEPHFVRKDCRRGCKIAISPQLLAIQPRFVRKGCRRGCKITILPQFLAIQLRFVRKGCVSCRLVGTAPRLKREIEKKEKEEGKRARGQESKRARENVKM